MADENTTAAPYVSLEDAKAYLRIEHPEEDELIKFLLMAAEEDAKSYIGVDDLTNVRNSEMVKLGIKYLVSWWYENRTPVSVGNTIPREMPLTVARLWWRERNVPL